MAELEGARAGGNAKSSPTDNRGHDGEILIMTESLIKTESFLAMY